MRRKILSTLSLLISACLWAANSLSVIQTTIGSGIETQSLNVIAKDQLGRLWIGSNVGVSVISNGTVTNIREVESEGGSVMLGNISSIACTQSALISSQDRILHYELGCDSAATLKYNGQILHTEDFLVEGNNVTFFDKDYGSLFSYNMENGICRLVASFKSDSEFSFSKIMRSESDSLTIYLADDMLGLYSYNRDNGIIQRVPGTDRPIIAKASAIDKSGMIWLSIPNGGIKGYYINSGYENVANYNTQNCNLPSDNISLVSPLNNGNLLLCHPDAGMCRLQRTDIANNRITVRNINDLNDVTSIMVSYDSHETLFATREHGLISIKESFMWQIGHLREKSNGVINYENYLSVFEEPQGTILVGTSGNGIKRIDVDRHIETVFPDAQKAVVSSMCRFDDRQVLMFDKSGQVLLFDRHTGKTAKLSRHPISDLIDKVNSRNVRFVNTTEGDIMIFNADGHHYIYRVDRNLIQEIRIDYDNGINLQQVENICVSPYAVYVTTHGSIIEINTASLQTKRVYYNNVRTIHNITSLAADSNGNLYFTEPQGLHRYDPRSNNDDLIVSTWGNGRFLNVAVDKNDRVWFSTTSEFIQMYDYAKKETLVYTVQDGVSKSHFLTHFSLCTASGTILFPNATGMLSIDTRSMLSKDDQPQPITCLSAYTDRNRITKAELDNSLIHPFKLSPSFRELHLEFSANSFNPTYPHQFIFTIYRDDTPVMSINSSGTTLSIPRMDHGKYTLEVQQIYRNGLSESRKIISYVIRKPFLKSIPGLILSLALVVLFGYSIARFSSTIEKNRMEKAMAEQDIKNREDKIAFLSNIAHELRTPLSLIYNPVKDFLQEKSVDGIDYERMERIFNQVNKMTVMVNMILDSSRADVNKADILIEEVDLNEWLNYLLEDYRIDCYGKGFKLKFIVDKSIGKVSIDKRIIETGLSNMVNNAIKYSPSGTTITVSTAKIGQDTIRVSVKDQGRGFTCNSEDLFKRYYRENVDNSIPGYGLGLPYARLQLSLIGGNMSAVNNTDGVGSTFFMDFPQVVGENGKTIVKESPTQTPQTKATATTGPKEPESPAETEEAMAQDFDTRNMAILLVCADNKELENLLKEFNGMFRLIMTAHNGKEAVSILERMTLDMVITDADMPEMDGFELCRHIKSTFQISHIPVLLLTRRSDSRNRKLGYKTGADAFLPKPYDIKQLLTIIRSQLGGRFEIKRQFNYGFFTMMNPDQTFSVTDEQFIENLNQVIKSNLSDPGFSDETIHKQLGLSRTLLLKKMEGLLGTNIAGYLIRIRNGFVKDKLLNTDDELETIAKDSGFESVDQMNLSFRKETGKTVYSFRE